MENNDMIEKVVDIPAEETQDEEIGNIKISADVVATIAGIAASEIEGVAGMYSSLAGGIAEIFNAKKSPTKGIKVEINGTSAIIDLYIIVDYGIRIPELSWELQENVKNNVETMTGLSVEKVNIHVEGVSFEKEKEKSAPVVTDDEIIVEEAEIELLPTEDEELE